MNAENAVTVILERITVVNSGVRIPGVRNGCRMISGNRKLITAAKDAVALMRVELANLISVLH